MLQKWKFSRPSSSLRARFTILCIATSPYKASRNLWGFIYVHPQQRTANVEAF